jgi:DNA-binding FrmR family transcriptional regulator
LLYLLGVGAPWSRKDPKRRSLDCSPDRIRAVGHSSRFPRWSVEPVNGPVSSQTATLFVGRRFRLALFDKNTIGGYRILSIVEVSVAIDERVQQKALRRLSIIEGQLRGLRKMVEERKYCVDILTQISAIHEALRGVGKVVVRNHLETCVTEGLQGSDREQHYDELMDLIYKLSK